MRYGINFGSGHIPPHVKRLFASRKYFDGGKGSDWYTLQGVCETQEECDEMLIQANNGHRRLRWVKRHNWFAIYVG